MPAISSASTSSFSIFRSFWTSASFAEADAILFSRSATTPYRSSATRARSPSRSFRSDSVFASSTCPFIFLIDWMSSFSTFQCALRAVRCSPHDASSLSISASLSFDPSSLSRRIPSRSISSCFIFRSTESSSSGIESISMRSFDAASSIRSIALSGRNRSGMYRSLNCAAATMAPSVIRTP